MTTIRGPPRKSSSPFSKVVRCRKKKLYHRRSTISGIMTAHRAVRVIVAKPAQVFEQGSVEFAVSRGQRHEAGDRTAGLARRALDQFAPALAQVLRLRVFGLDLDCDDF